MNIEHTRTLIFMLFALKSLSVTHVLRHVTCQPNCFLHQSIECIKSDIIHDSRGNNTNICIHICFGSSFDFHITMPCQCIKFNEKYGSLRNLKLAICMRERERGRNFSHLSGCERVSLLLRVTSLVISTVL